MPGETLNAKWSHRRGDRYVVICTSVVGSPQSGYRVEHYRPPGEPTTRAAAKRRGFALGRADDFNLGAIRDGRLVAVLWMDEVTDDDPGLLAEIAMEVGL